MKEIPVKLLNMSDELVQLVRVGAKTRSYIAGGAARAVYNGQKPTDIDFFQSDPVLFDTLVANLKTIGYKVQFDNPMLVRMIKTDAITIDCVRPREAENLKTFGTPEEIIGNFDFTVCAATFKDEHTLIVDDNFEQDNADMRLRIIHIVCPINEVKRIAKYANKGFKIGAVEILKLFTTWTSRQAHADLLTELLGLVESGAELTPEQSAALGTAMYVD